MIEIGRRLVHMTKLFDDECSQLVVCVAVQSTLPTGDVIDQLSVNRV